MAEEKKDLRKPCFMSAVACEIGVYPALLLEHIRYWVHNNSQYCVDSVYKEGKYWTYGSISTLQRKYFPYLTAKQIRTALDKLKNEGLVEVNVFNEKAYDKTKWYTLTKDGYKLVGETSPSDEQTEHLRVF